MNSDERERELTRKLTNSEFMARGLARSRYHDRLFSDGRPRPTNEQFDEGWNAARDFYIAAMRDKCVEAVKSLRRSTTGITDETLEEAILRRNLILAEVVIELESLTLDQVQGRQHGTDNLC